MSTQVTRQFTQPQPPIVRPYSTRKILFASAQSILDFSNAVAVATLEMFQTLTTFGWECQNFCTAKFDLD